jgi:hypothetical protein
MEEGLNKAAPSTEDTVDPDVYFARLMYNCLRCRPCDFEQQQLNWRVSNVSHLDIPSSAGYGNDNNNTNNGTKEGSAPKEDSTTPPPSADDLVKVCLKYGPDILTLIYNFGVIIISALAINSFATQVTLTFAIFSILLVVLKVNLKTNDLILKPRYEAYYELLTMIIICICMVIFLSNVSDDSTTSGEEIVTVSMKLIEPFFKLLWLSLKPNFYN